MPPFGPKDRLLGLDALISAIYHGLKGDLLQHSHQDFLRLGPTIRSKHLWIPTIHTNDPDNIEHVLKTRFQDFHLLKARASAMAIELGHGIFTSDGEAWTKSRKTLRPSFNKANFPKYLQIMETHFQHLRHRILDYTMIDLQELFLSYALDTSTEVLFGRSVNSLQNDSQGVQNDGSQSDQNFMESFTALVIQIVRRIALGPLQSLLWDWTYQSRLNARSYMDQYVQDALNFRKSQQSNAVDKDRDIFIQELANNETDPERIRGEILHALLASRDTTASLLGNLFFELARNPSVWKKLYNEIEFLGGTLPTCEDLRKLTFLKYCTQECKSVLPSKNQIH
jgi:cytochrome P450